MHFERHSANPTYNFQTCYRNTLIFFIWPKFHLTTRTTLSVYTCLQVSKLDKSQANGPGLLAGQSRRLMGELIVYQSLRRPSVRPSLVGRPSTFSNIFSVTTGPIELMETT